MDGRDDVSQGHTMSIRSKLSRAISIRSRNTTMVHYGRASKKIAIADINSAILAGKEKVGVM